MTKPSGSSKPTSTILPYQTPRLRDHYVLGKKLGQGQFGTTYLCTEKSTGTYYACKSIAKHKLLCRDDYEDVSREIQIMHHSSNPLFDSLSRKRKEVEAHVVRIKGTYEDNVFVHKWPEFNRQRRFDKQFEVSGEFFGHLCTFRSPLHFPSPELTVHWTEVKFGT